MSQSIFINEVFPNPESGSEWIEFYTSEENSNGLSLSNYTIFDSYHQIYKFSNEKFIDHLLVVEVSGLNNDQDSVSLKDETGNTIDSFQYVVTQKGLSFAKNLKTEIFTIDNPSRNQINPSINITPTLTQNPNPTTIASSTNEKQTSLSTTPTSEPTNTKTQTTSAVSNHTNAIPNLPYKYHQYDLSKVILITRENKFQERLTRLVFLGENQERWKIINAIIGSSLIILSSLFLIYVKIKKRPY